VLKLYPVKLGTFFRDTVYVTHTRTHTYRDRHFIILRPCLLMSPILILGLKKKRIPGKVDRWKCCGVRFAVLEFRRLLIPHWKRAEESVGKETGNLLP